jgi:hypothetical protein
MKLIKVFLLSIMAVFVLAELRHAEGAFGLYQSNWKEESQYIADFMSTHNLIVTRLIAESEVFFFQPKLNTVLIWMPNQLTKGNLTTKVRLNYSSCCCENSFEGKVPDGLSAAILETANGNLTIRGHPD